MGEEIKEVVPYEGGPLGDAQELFEWACSHYLELMQEEGKPPRIAAVIDRLMADHEGLVRSEVKTRLESKAFNEELQKRRKENLAITLAPRLLLAELASQIGRTAAEEIVDRLKDPETRAKIKDRDLVALVKAASEMVQGADNTLDDVAAQTSINKGTIVQLFAQLSPERAAVLMQEIARKQIGEERSA